MRRSLTVLAMTVLLGGCSVWGQMKDSIGLIPSSAEIELNINTAMNLNQRSDGSSSPVILRVYELSSPILFRSLGFFSLFEDDRSSLGDEYIYRHEFQLEPGQHWNDTLTLDENTRAVGFAVAFRDVNGSTWRKSYDIKDRTSYYLDINIEGNTLDVLNTVGVEQIIF